MSTVENTGALRYNTVNNFAVFKSVYPCVIEVDFALSVSSPSEELKKKQYIASEFIQ